MSRYKFKIGLLSAGLFLSALTCVNAIAAEGVWDTSATGIPANQTVFAQYGAQKPSATSLPMFVPKQQTKSTRLDYSLWNDVLENTVLPLGNSIRRRASRPVPITGSRRISGHRSAYRLEGSRVMFSYFNDEYRTGIVAYRKDLERIANQIDITRLGKKEQLAFWINLHNVGVVEQIALQYPVRKPSEMKAAGTDQVLDEAKIFNIKGVALSLRDIREDIVYANWSEPDVIYGFFRGDIGSPALQRYAYTGDNVMDVLNISAYEFVNSLRGFNSTPRARKVSRIYDEARPYYFKNWEYDVQRHLIKHAMDELHEPMSKDKPMEVDRYDLVVADLLAGERPSTAKLNVEINGYSQSASVPPEIGRLLRELESKTNIMRKRGMLVKRGVVTIEDIDSIDVEIPPATSNSEIPNN